MTSAAGKKARPAWLTKGVFGIGAASLLSDLGHEVPTSLLPSLLTTVFAAPAAALGVIEGIADALAGIAARWRTTRTAVERPQPAATRPQRFSPV